MGYPEVPKIVVTPPGPKARAILERDRAVISPSYVRFYPLVVERGEGSVVIDVDGNRYIDFNSGLLCLNVGHCHPRIVSAVVDQVRKLIHYSNTDFYYEESVLLAEKLVQIAPGRFDKKVYYGNSGTEAVEAALKLVRWHTRRPYIIAFIGAFHGRTFGSLSLTSSKPVQRRYFGPLLPGVFHVPYPYCYRCPFQLNPDDCNYWCVSFIEEWLFKKFVPPEEVAAIVFEPIQGEGGYVVPPPEFFPRLRKLCDQYDILMVDDEVQAGMGRTGEWCAINHWDTVPDIVCFAKALASGFPLGATVARSELMDWVGGSHASTFGGNPVSCRAALETISIIEEERLLDKAKKDGAYITKRFKELSEKSAIIGDVRGKGLMIGVEIVEDKKSRKPGVKLAREVMLRAWKRGIAVITCGICTLRIAPPLNIPRELLDKGLEILEQVIMEVDRERNSI